MNKLAAMEVFVKIAECGSLTGAADALDTSLPTVVRTLAKLERYLSVRLFNRTTRKVVLTDEGRVYLQRCRRLLADIQEAENLLSSAQNQISGAIKVTAPVMFGTQHVTPLLAEFLNIYTNVSAELLLLDRNVNLVDEAIDVAVRIGHLNDSNNIARQVGQVNWVVCAAPDLLETLGTPHEPEELKGYPCVQFEGLGLSHVWQFEREQKRVSVNVTGKFKSNQIGACLAAVAQGVGLGTFLSYQVKPMLASGQLVKVLEAFEPQSIPVNVLYTQTNLMSARVKVFVEWLSQALRQELA